MPVKIRDIALTMVVSYGVTAAFLWWRQPPAIKVEPFVSQPAPPMQRLAGPPPMMPRVQPAEPPHAAPIPVAVKAAVPAPNYEGPPLPVYLNINIEPAHRNRRRSNAGGEEPDAAKDVHVANILNSSDKALELTVIDLNPSTQKATQASVLLLPRDSQTVGQTKGLAMESGDQITLRSDGFQDLTQAVP